MCVSLQFLKLIVMIPMALPEREREHGPHSETPNEQLEDTRISGGQNIGEREDHEAVVEGPSVVPPGDKFNDDQLGEGEPHTARSRRSGGESGVLATSFLSTSINIYQSRREPWMLRCSGLSRLSQRSPGMDSVHSKLS